MPLTILLSGLVLAGCAQTAVPTKEGAPAAKRTVGLFVKTEKASPGYQLFSPRFSNHAFLIDLDGQVINRWVSENPTWMVRMADDGRLLRVLQDRPAEAQGLPGVSGRVQIVEWDGTVVWDYQSVAEDVLLHHDAEIMPNGNVLLNSFERRTAQEAVAAGRDPETIPPQGYFLSERVIEVKPTGPATGEIVWEWVAWDHLIQDFDNTRENYGVLADNPNRLDINYFRQINRDMHHVNGLDYNPERDEVMISLHIMDEIIIVDHAPARDGSAGKGGDIIYRWGNPQVYGAGLPEDRHLSVLHDARWIKPGLPGAGNILVLNNGIGRIKNGGSLYSTVEEIVPPLDENGDYIMENGRYGPDKPIWQYRASPRESFYAQNMGSAQRQPNGNTVINEAQHARLFEVTPDGEIVWEYVNPMTMRGPLAKDDPIPFRFDGLETAIFISDRISVNHPGLEGRDLSPKGPIELLQGPSPAAVSYRSNPENIVPPGRGPGMRGYRFFEPSPRYEQGIEVSGASPRNK